MMPRLSLRFALAVVLAYLLAACSLSSPGSHSVSLPSASGPSPNPVQAVDALGRVVSLGAPPRRIVLAGKASLLLADALYAFPDAPQRVVALTKGKQSLDFLKLLDPDVQKKAVLAREVGPEQIAALHPDLVIIKSFLYPKLGKSLEALGIPVFTMRLEAPEQYPRELRELGKLLGEEKRGDALADYFAGKMDFLQQTLDSANGLSKPQVLVLRSGIRGNRGAFAVPPKNWIQTRMVVLAGGRPVWGSVQGSGWTPIPLEQIAAWNPDVIFVVSYQRPPAEAVKKFTSLRLASALKAVRDDKVFPIPADFISWDQPDTRWILGAQWMAKKMHPDLFAPLDMREAVSEFYRTLYGFDESRLKAVWAKLGW